MLRLMCMLDLLPQEAAPFHLSLWNAFVGSLLMFLSYIPERNKNYSAVFY